MPTMTIFDLSTAHMKSTDAEILRGYKADGSQRRQGESYSLIAYPYEYGWTVSTSPINADHSAEEIAERIQGMKDEGFSDEFVAIVQHASSIDAALVRFDADGALEEGFPAFNWERGDEPMDEDERDSMPSM